MKNARRSFFAAAMTVAFSLCWSGIVSAAPVTEIPAGETFYVGGDGSDPYNTQGGFIILNAGSTLVVTQSAALTVWSGLIVTNGNAVVEFRPNDADASPSFRGHMFVREEGSLKIKGAKSVNIGHDRSPIYDIENLSIEMEDGNLTIGASATMLSFPKSCKIIEGAKSIIWLCGLSDMFPNVEEVSIDRGRYVLANATAIPSTKPIRLSNAGQLLVASRILPEGTDLISTFPLSVEYSQAAVYTNYNNITFQRSQIDIPKLIVTNKNNCVMKGDLSGVGEVEVSGGKASYSAKSPFAFTLAGDNSDFSGRISLCKPFVKLVLDSDNASGNAIIEPRASDTTVVGVNGCESRIDTGTNGCNVKLSGRGEFILDKAQRQFADSVTYWFDFSRIDTYSYPGEGITDYYANAKYEGTYPIVERVIDWRYPDAPDSLWNRRVYMDGEDVENVKKQYFDHVYGCRMNDAGAQNDMSYFAMPSGRSRRLPFSPAEGYNKRSTAKVQMAVMVFNSRYGGGNALIGTSNGALGRDGATIAHGITTNAKHKVWVDGVEISPNAPNVLNGAWQIISISMDGESFDGLGWNNYAIESVYGGQCYGELLLFTEPISEVQRLDAEIYLAKKWGLAETYSQEACNRHEELLRVTNNIMLTDGAVVKANGDSVKLLGLCNGAVHMSGGKLTTDKYPMRENEVPSEGRIFWLDADDESTITRKKDLNQSQRRIDEIRAVRDKSSASYEVGRPFAFGTNTRSPTWMKMSRNGGPIRGWIDFNEYYYADKEANDGNNLRFGIYTSGYSFANDTPELADMSSRTVFVVQDSYGSYATPLIDSVTGSNVKPRISASSPIWASGTTAAFTQGENRLNGKIVNQGNGFTQDTEVFTVRATEPVNIPFIEYYKNSENLPYEKGTACAIGEILYYSTELTDSQVQGIESYLMKKWMNRLPPGFADVTAVTITGTGSIDVEAADALPEISPTFSGDVRVADNQGFEMLLDAASDAVSGAIILPDTVLELPPACTIKVDFAERPLRFTKRVEYVLINCAGFKNAVEWNFVRGTNVSSQGEFVIDESGNKISIVFKPVGCRIIVR